MSMPRVSRLALETALLGLVVGCASSMDRPEDQSPESATPVTVEDLARQAKAAGFDSQYELLKDGVASKSDYDEAMAQAFSCMQEQGLRPEPGYVNKADSLTMIVLVNNADVPEEDAAIIATDCLEAKKNYVETAYLSTHTAVMDAALLAESIACLQEKGVELSGNETNLPDLRDAAGKGQRAVVEDCVGDASDTLYPDLVISLSGG